ncbi:hypothetical protein N8368_01630 [Bacteroidia bacterium]|nr:hypothetical protein [Bacteroidia bacterium]MDC1395189.1 hypothetical protein [Bacteroidia bacterium]
MYCKNKQELAEQVNKYTEGIIVILAAEKEFSFADIQPILQNAKVPSFGAFFPGIIANREIHYSGFLIQHFSMEGEVFSFNSKDLESLSFASKKLDQGTGLILLDGLADNNQDFLNRVFYELGNDFRFIGSGAGSLDLVQKPCVFDKDGIYQDKAIVLLLKAKVAIGIQRGYQRVAGPIVATETKDSKIFELNWGNAFETYSKIVNEQSNSKITKDDFFNVSKGYPLGITRKGYEDIVRDPISVKERGTLNCIDDIPENEALYMLKGEPARLIESAKVS